MTGIMVCRSQDMRRISCISRLIGTIQIHQPDDIQNHRSGRIPRQLVPGKPIIVRHDGCPVLIKRPQPQAGECRTPCPTAIMGMLEAKGMPQFMQQQGKAFTARFIAWQSCRTASQVQINVTRLPDIGHIIDKRGEVTDGPYTPRRHEPARSIDRNGDFRKRRGFQGRRKISCIIKSDVNKSSEALQCLIDLACKRGGACPDLTRKAVRNRKINGSRPIQVPAVPGGQRIDEAYAGERCWSTRRGCRH